MKKAFLRILIASSCLLTFPVFSKDLKPSVATSLLQGLVEKKPKPLETLKLLQALIAFNTSNPPGNEKGLVQNIQAYLARFGISSEIIESASGRANLIARLKGNGSKETLALLGHLDVVPADSKEWDQPPFEAKVVGDTLFGRGALDMKGMVALEINTFIRLKLEKVPLRGDVILVLVADEEAGGKLGAQFLVENHWDKVAAKYVFNEGSIGVKKGKKNLYPIQVAEKGVAWMKMSAAGSSGHGSMPRKDNAVLRLINALHRLMEKEQPIQKTAVVEEFLRRTSGEASWLTGWYMRHFFDWPFVKLAPWLAGKQIREEKAFNAMIRNTLSPTMLQAGYKVNVIPAEATAFIDARILPGFTPKGFMEGLQTFLNDSNLKFELVQESLPNESNFHTPFFEAIEKVIEEQDPQALVTPYISPGATDSRFFRAKGAIAYGLIPFVIAPEEIDSVHGKNERLRVTELSRGEKILYNMVVNLQGGTAVHETKP